MLCCILNKIICKNRGSNTNEIKQDLIQEFINNSNKYLLVDVRSPLEYNEGHLRGSINIPFYRINKNTEKLIPKDVDLIIVYCQTGYRSKKVANYLLSRGYKNVYNIKGGIEK